MKTLAIACVFAAFLVAGSSCRRVDVPPAPVKQGEELRVWEPGEVIGKIEVRQVDLKFKPTPQDNVDEISTDTAEVLANAFCDYHDRFQFLRGKDWYRTAQLFRNRLIGLAKEEGLDAESLARCIDAYAVKPDSHTAYVPIGAFGGKYGSEPVWIVVYIWEIAYHETRRDERTTLITGNALGHIWIRVIRMKDAMQVAQMHCS